MYNNGVVLYETVSEAVVNSVVGIQTTFRKDIS